MEMIRKLVPVEVKEVGERVLEMAGSTEDKDRMGDVIKAKGWKLKEFKKNPVILWAHNYNEPPIGRATNVWIDKETNKLMFNVEFADPETYEFADTIFKLYKGGFLHATSVGFIPLQWEGKDEDDENSRPKFEGNIFTSQELLELSAVPVPANANALVTARSQGVITEKELLGLGVEEIKWDYPGYTHPELDITKDRPLLISTKNDVITKPEETEDFIRIPVRECKISATIDISKDEGIKALYCGKEKKVATYLFSKDEKYGWTMKKAQKWVDEHDEKSIESCEITPKEISQEALCDEMDYTLKAIEEVGISEETMPKAQELADAITKRLPGADIPVHIEPKITEKVMPQYDPKQRARDVAEVANLVIARLKGKRIR